MQFVYKVAMALAALAVSGCVSNVFEGSRSRGTLAYASTDNTVGSFLRLGTDRVAGRACFNGALMYLNADDPIFERAVVDALKSTPEATVLLDVELLDTGPCFEISGIPARTR